MSRFSEDEENRPATIKNIFHPLSSRLYFLSKESINFLEIENDYKQITKIIERNAFNFDHSDVLTNLKQALANVNSILNKGVENIEIEIPDNFPFNESDIPNQREHLKMELAHYEKSLTQMVAYMEHGDDQKPVEVGNDDKKVSKGITGLSIFAIADSEPERLKKLGLFCKQLEDSELIAKNDVKLITKAFSGQTIPRKLDWIGPLNELQFLLKSLVGSGLDRLVVQKDKNKIWKRACECFTNNGEAIIPNNLKTNNSLKDSSRMQEINRIVQILK